MSGSTSDPLGTLKDYGPVSRTAMKMIEKKGWLPGIIEADCLPPSQKERPECPVSVPSKSGGIRGLYAYKSAMREYLSAWLEIDESYPWTVYETLANYCESKVKH